MGSVAQRRTEQNDVASLLLLPQGVRFIRQLLQLTGVWSASYVCNDALASAYNEGRRSVGLYVLQQVQMYAPQSIEKLLGWEGTAGPAQTMTWGGEAE